MSESEGAIHDRFQKKALQKKGNRKCKGPEAGVGWAVQRAARKPVSLEQEACRESEKTRPDR